MREAPWREAMLAAFRLLHASGCRREEGGAIASGNVWGAVSFFRVCGWGRMRSRPRALRRGSYYLDLLGMSAYMYGHRLPGARRWLGAPRRSPELLSACFETIASNASSPIPGEIMARKKISTTVYITPEQNEKLKLLNEKTKVPVAEYIRQGIDLVLEQHHDQLPGQLTFEDRLWQGSGGE